uniref:Twin arginine translocase protein A n=1 Tax=Parastrongyloides trichosuri TaxID=131310 RepID=A0A0N4ZWA7_PARTI
MLMRRVGQFVGKARGMANEFRASFDEMARQSELDDLRKEVEALRSGQGMYALGADADEAFKDIRKELEAPLETPAVPEPVEQAPAQIEVTGVDEWPDSATPVVAPEPAPKPATKPRAKKADVAAGAAASKVKSRKATPKDPLPVSGEALCGLGRLPPDGGRARPCVAVQPDPGHGRADPRAGRGPQQRAADLYGAARNPVHQDEAGGLGRRHRGLPGAGLAAVPLRRAGPVSQREGRLPAVPDRGAGAVPAGRGAGLLRHAAVRDVVLAEPADHRRGRGGRTAAQGVGLSEPGDGADPGLRPVLPVAGRHDPAGPCWSDQQRTDGQGAPLRYRGGGRGRRRGDAPGSDQPADAGRADGAALRGVHLASDPRSDAFSTPSGLSRITYDVNCVPTIPALALFAVAAIVQLGRAVTDQGAIDEVGAATFMELGSCRSDRFGADKQFSRRQGQGLGGDDGAFDANAGACGRGVLPAMPRRARHECSGRQADGGNDPTDVRHIGRPACAIETQLGGLDFTDARQGRLAGQGLLELGCESRFLGRPGDAADAVQVADDLWVAVADVVVGLRIVGHHIGRFAAVGDDIVDARSVRNVLAHHIGHGVHGLDGVQGRAPAIRRAGGVGGRAVEAELAADVGLGRALAGAVDGCRVPMKRDIHVSEQAVADHEGLGRAAFFGGRAIDAQLALDVVVNHPLADGDGGMAGGRAEQVMAATVAGDRMQGLFDRRYRLRQAGQGVELSQQGDHRALAVLEAGDESGRLAGDACGDREAGGLGVGQAGSIFDGGAPAASVVVGRAARQVLDLERVDIADHGAQRQAAGRGGQADVGQVKRPVDLQVHAADLEGPQVQRGLTRLEQEACGRVTLAHDLTIVVVHVIGRDPVKQRRGERRLDDRAERVGVGGFFLQVGVAAGEGEHLGGAELIGRKHACRHAHGQAQGLDLGGVGAALTEAAAIAGANIARVAAERGRRTGAADACAARRFWSSVDDAPVNIDLIGANAAYAAVIRIAITEVHIDLASHRHILQQGNQSLEVDLADAGVSAGRPQHAVAQDVAADARNVVKFVGVVLEGVVAIAETGRHADFPGREVEQPALQVQFGDPLFHLVGVRGPAGHIVHAALGKRMVAEEVGSALAEHGIGDHAHGSACHGVVFHPRTARAAERIVQQVHDGGFAERAVLDVVGLGLTHAGEGIPRPIAVRHDAICAQDDLIDVIGVGREGRLSEDRGVVGDIIVKLGKDCDAFVGVYDLAVRPAEIELFAAAGDVLGVRLRVAVEAQLSRVGGGAGDGIGAIDIAEQIVDHGGAGRVSGEEHRAGIERRRTVLKRARDVERPIVLERGFAHGIVDRHHGAAAALGESLTGGDGRAELFAVAVFADATEVDHARRGVRTIGGRGAAGDDFDVADQGFREGVQVDRAVRRRRLHPATVQQDQRALGAQASQACVGLAGVQGRGAAAGAGLAEGAGELGQLRQGAFDRHLTGVLDSLGRDGHDRAVGHVVRARDARAGHDDIAHLRGGGLVGGGGRTIEKAIEEQPEGAGRLGALQNFDAVDEELALADVDFDHGRSVLQQLLMVRPAAAQRRIGVEPGHGLRAFADDAIGLAIGEEDVSLGRHAEGQRVEELSRGQGPLRSILFLDQGRSDGRAQQVRQAIGAADRDDRAAVASELGDLGHGAVSSHFAQPGAIGFGNVLGLRQRLVALGTIGRVIEHGRGAVGEDQDVEPFVQVSGGESLRIDHLERELVLLEQPAGPARAHDPAIAVDQADANGLQGDGAARRLAVHGIGVEAQLADRRSYGCSAFGRGLHPQGARLQLGAPDLGAVLQPFDAGPRLQQAVGQDEAVVDLVGDDKTRAPRTDDRARRRVQQVVRPAEGAVKAVQHAIERHPHLIGQSVSGDVVRQLGRAAGVFGVVRMVLRLEHVQHVGPEGLGGLHHIGALRIALSANGERGAGDLNVDAAFHQSVEEGHRGGQVALFFRVDDEAARIAVLGRLQHRIEQARVDGAAVGGGGRRFQRVDFLGRDGPTVLAAALDAVGAHLIDAHQQTFAIARGVVDDGPVHRPLVVDAVLEMPHPGADRHGLVIAGQLGLRDQRNGFRRRPADDLGQDADHVVEIGGRPIHAVVPGRVGGDAVHP